MGNQAVIEALSVLDAIVAEYGADHVYETEDGVRAGSDPFLACKYVHGYEPGCIVGNYYARKGISLDRLSEFEGEPADDLASAFGDPYEVGAVLRWAQIMQDTGAPWGESVERARSFARVLQARREC